MKKAVSKTIGILGGGQLGKMLFEAGSSLNLSYIFLENNPTSPASLVCNNQVVGSLQDEESIRTLATKSDVLSFEIEHVNVAALKQLESEGKQIIPKPAVLSIIQDKGLQKDFYSENDIPTLDYQIASLDSLEDAVAGWKDDKFVLKHRKGGYDGKGVQLLSKSSFNSLLSKKDQSLQSDTGYVLEKMAKDAIEISVIVAVAQDMSTLSYEPCEMVFNPKSNLMDYLIAPSSLGTASIEKCKQVAQKAVTAFNSPGLFAVELFVEKSGGVYVNEIAPRPHNSGHHTIESAYTSQYEQLNRILLGLPLGDCSLVVPAATCNIVGPDDVNGSYYLDNIDEVMATSGVYIHMYGKSTTSPDRKLGHFTVLGRDREEVINKMEKVKSLLTIKSN